MGRLRGSAAKLAEARGWVVRDFGFVLWAPCQARGVGWGSGFIVAEWGRG